MNQFFDSLKADLTDRRLLPALVALGVALLAAVGYAALAPGGSGAPAVAPPAPIAQRPAGIAGIVLAPSSQSDRQAVAETTSGAPEQRGGVARNPFSPIAVAHAARSSHAAKSSHSSKSTSSAHVSASKSATKSHSGGSSAPAPKPAQPSKPSKPTPSYNVAVLFGPAPSGKPGDTSALTPYENLKRFTALPSAKAPLVAFMGVTSGGKSATFEIVGEAILRGQATCVPNPAQCQAIAMKRGQSELLEYLSSKGQATTYELKVVSISPVNAKAATTSKIASAGESQAGRQALRHAGRLTLPGLRYLSAAGVVELTAAPA